MQFALRRMVIQEAHSWIGTHFHHQGRIKCNSIDKGGCDCIGLILGIAEKFKFRSNLDNRLLSDHDLSNYSKFPQKNNLSAHLEKHLITLPNNNIRNGDIALFKISSFPQHIGIFAKDSAIYLIHAYQDVGYVCKHFFSEIWQDRLVKIFSFKELHK